ncbi:MAG TPA: N-acetyltransferase [Ruminiclostridium sp.]|nr:N-acetyltransferase [Ruminiclostridium sp.]
MAVQPTDIRVEQAGKNDIPQIAALFTSSFRESVLHHCGKIPKPQAMEDVFSLVWEAEPAAAFIARTASGVTVGYCFAPVRLSALWMRSILHGHIIKWAWRWLTGQYGFGFYPVKIIVINKLLFLHSSVQPTQAANARILSIAVDDPWRGKGVAGAMMAKAMDYFTVNKVVRARLEVRPDNTPALRVYEKYGFVPAGKTRDSQGEWLIMFKEMEHNSCSI